MTLHLYLIFQEIILVTLIFTVSVDFILVIDMNLFSSSMNFVKPNMKLACNLCYIFKVENLHICP